MKKQSIKADYLEKKGRAKKFFILYEKETGKRIVSAKKEEGIQKKVLALAKKKGCSSEDVNEILDKLKLKILVSDKNLSEIPEKFISKAEPKKSEKKKAEPKKSEKKTEKKPEKSKEKSEEERVSARKYREKMRQILNKETQEKRIASLKRFLKKLGASKENTELDAKREAKPYGWRYGFVKEKKKEKTVYNRNIKKSPTFADVHKWISEPIRRKINGKMVETTRAKYYGVKGRGLKKAIQDKLDFYIYRKYDLSGTDFLPALKLEDGNVLVQSGDILHVKEVENLVGKGNLSFPYVEYQGIRLRKKFLQPFYVVE